MQEMDVFLSIGPNCRAISYLRGFNLTWFASPADWYVFRKPDTLLQLYRNQFSDFLLSIEEYEPCESEKEFRFVRDTQYNVKSVHQFEKNLSLSAGQAYVRNRTLLRVQKTNQALAQAKTIGLVGNWNVPRGELVDFLHGFSELYPGKKIVLSNIRHIPGEPRHWKTETSLSPTLSLDEYFFCDEGEKGSPDYWRGNQYLWSQIIGQFCLSPESKKRRDEVCRNL